MIKNLQFSYKIEFELPKIFKNSIYITYYATYQTSPLKQMEQEVHTKGKAYSFCFLNWIYYNIFQALKS